MRLILLGPPGSGKGTQAALLCHRLHLDHVGTGDIIRTAISNHTPLGERFRSYVDAGGLVPDELVNDLVADHFRSAGAGDRFVMDGYPRTLDQAEAFDRLLVAIHRPLTRVLLLDVNDEEIIHRVAGRWSCPKKGCKATYHTESNPPKVAEICDKCGTRLEQRPDDKPETVRRRLVVYHRDTAELIPFYRKRGLLREVPGYGEIEQIYNSLVKALEP